MEQMISSKTVKIRKPHVCFGCGREFSAGTKMRKDFSVDPQPLSVYVCESCQEAESYMEPGDFYGFGDLLDTALEIEEERRG